MVGSESPPPRTLYDTSISTIHNDEIMNSSWLSSSYHTAVTTTAAHTSDSPTYDATTGSDAAVATGKLAQQSKHWLVPKTQPHATVRCEPITVGRNIGCEKNKERPISFCILKSDTKPNPIRIEDDKCEAAQQSNHDHHRRRLNQQNPRQRSFSLSIVADENSNSHSKRRPTVSSDVVVPTPAVNGTSTHRHRSVRTQDLIARLDTRRSQNFQPQLHPQPREGNSVSRWNQKSPASLSAAAVAVVTPFSTSSSKQPQSQQLIDATNIESPTEHNRHLLQTQHDPRNHQDRNLLPEKSTTKEGKVKTMLQYDRPGLIQTWKQWHDDMQTRSPSSPPRTPPWQSSFHSKAIASGLPASPESERSNFLPPSLPVLPLTSSPSFKSPAQTPPLQQQKHCNFVQVENRASSGQSSPSPAILESESITSPMIALVQKLQSVPRDNPNQALAEIDAILKGSTRLSRPTHQTVLEESETREDHQLTATTANNNRTVNQTIDHPFKLTFRDLPPKPVKDDTLYQSPRVGRIIRNYENDIAKKAIGNQIDGHIQKRQCSVDNGADANDNVGDMDDDANSNDSDVTSVSSITNPTYGVMGADHPHGFFQPPESVGTHQGDGHPRPSTLTRRPSVPLPIAISHHPLPKQQQRHPSHQLRYRPNSPAPSSVQVPEDKIFLQQSHDITFNKLLPAPEEKLKSSPAPAPALAESVACTSEIKASSPADLAHKIKKWDDTSEADCNVSWSSSKMKSSVRNVPAMQLSTPYVPLKQPTSSQDPNLRDNFDSAWVSLPSSTLFIRQTSLHQQPSEDSISKTRVVSVFKEVSDTGGLLQSTRSHKQEAFQTFRPREESRTKDIYSRIPKLEDKIGNFGISTDFQRRGSADVNKMKAALIDEAQSLKKILPFSFDTSLRKRGLRGFLKLRKMGRASSTSQESTSTDSRSHFHSGSLDLHSLVAEAPPPSRGRSLHSIRSSADDRSRARSLDERNIRNPNIAKKFSRLLRVYEDTDTRRC